MGIWSKISKIILLILCIGITSMFGYITIDEMNYPLNEELWDDVMFLFLTIALSGLATLFYHIKSILFLWDMDKFIAQKRRISDLFWFSPFVFSSSIIFSIILISYRDGIPITSDDDFIILSFLLALILIGLWHIIEAIKTRKRYKRYLNHSKLNIDEIGQS